MVTTKTNIDTRRVCIFFPNEYQEACVICMMRYAFEDLKLFRNYA